MQLKKNLDFALVFWAPKQSQNISPTDKEIERAARWRTCNKCQATESPAKPAPITAHLILSTKRTSGQPYVFDIKFKDECDTHI